MDWKGKVVIITGGASGIGRALAIHFAQLSCRLALADRDAEKLREVTEAARKMSSEVIMVPTDVTREDECRKLIETTVERFGIIDVLINNAGISMRAVFEAVDLRVLHQLMDVNFWGTVYCSKYALPYLLHSKGSLVGVISIAGYVGLPGRTGYSASKFAVRGFLDTVRCENQYKGLHVLVAAPGFTSTNIRKTALTANGSNQGETPRNESKMMTPEKVATLIICAIEKRKNSLILTFKEGKLTVLLNKFFPSWISKMAYNHMAKEPDSPFK
ncbi:MAG: SDR family oxidoreductase [Bacteroidetes bacterium]|nr:SDR family oxidoreductase [Bacteroidota bacterium]